MASRPGPVLRRVLGAPAALYRAGGGRWLGHRFLLLTHRGRRSGRRYETVLEVVRWDAEREEATVMSGFGRGAQWYRNVLAGGAAEVQIGRRRFASSVRVLDPDEAAAALAAYERANHLIAPLVRRVLSRLAERIVSRDTKRRHTSRA